MEGKTVYYDGSGEKQQSAGAGQKPNNVVITAEMRKSLSGNPYVFVK